MSENHDHTWLEQTERVLQTGQSSGDTLVDALAGTTPQARPEFRQALEAELIATLESQSLTSLEEVSQSMQTKNRFRQSEGRRRFRVALPLTLAAAVAVLLLAGAVLVMMNNRPPEESPVLSGAAQFETPLDAASTIPDQYMWTATAIIAQATYQAAEALFVQAQAQIETAQKQATEQAVQYRATAGFDDSPSYAMTQVVQTATAVIEQATQRAASPADPMVQTATAMIDRATQEAGALWTATAIASRPDLWMNCNPGLLTVYAQPGGDTPVVADVEPTDARYVMEGTLTLNDGSQWLLLTIGLPNGEFVRGWVQADVIRAACPQVLDTVPLATTVMGATSMVMTVIPAVEPVQALSTFTPTLVATPTWTHTPTIVPTATPIPSVTPTLVEDYGDQAVQVTLTFTEASSIDTSITVGHLVDVLMLVPPTHDPEIWVPVVQNAYVLEIRRGQSANSTRVRLNLPPGSDAGLLYQVTDAGITLKLMPAA